MTVVVNGRFLRATGAGATGIHRVARGLLDAARVAGLEAEVVAPAGTTDARANRVTRTPAGGMGSIGLHLWEQTILPLAARGRPILSLANTAPVAVRKGAVLVADLSPIVGPEWFTPRFRAAQRLVIVAARRARAVLVYSAQIGRELVAVGIDERRVSIVRPAVDDGFTRASGEEVRAARERHGLDRPYVLFVGWADPRKDVATAAAAHLEAARHAPHDLVLVGSGHRNFAPVRLPTGPSLRRVGSIAEGELRTLLSGASALLYPSRYEGFGLPPLEALACGTPAIVSDIPVLRESAGDEARYIAPGDVAAWASAIREAVEGTLAPGTPPAWTWSDAGASLLTALDRAGLTTGRPSRRSPG